VLHQRQTRDHLSVMGGVRPTGKLYVLGRGRPVPAIGAERFPRFLLQLAALRQEAAGLGREEARARRSREAICSAPFITEAVVVRMGPLARESQAHVQMRIDAIRASSGELATALGFADECAYLSASARPRH
jgi:hypothetical protein